jgi:hypothetical protein
MGRGGESHHRFAVPLKVNCRGAAREATLGCPLTGEAGTGDEILRRAQNDRAGGAGKTAGGAEPRPYGP